MMRRFVSGPVQTTRSLSKQVVVALEEELWQGAKTFQTKEGGEVGLCGEGFRISHTSLSDQTCTTE